MADPSCSLSTFSVLKKKKKELSTINLSLPVGNIIPNHTSEHFLEEITLIVKWQFKTFPVFKGEQWWAFEKIPVLTLSWNPS